MRIRKRSDFSKILFYCICGAALFMLRHVGKQGEPVGLALAFSMASANASPLLSAALYLLSNLWNFDLTQLWIAVAQSVLLVLSYLLQRKCWDKPVGKMQLAPLFALSISLGLFVAFSPFTAYPLPFDLPITLHTLTQKVWIAALCFLLFAVFSVSLKAVTQKLLKCRLRDDEMVFCILSLLIIGVGACRFLSVNAYMGGAFFILLLFAYVTKDASALLCAFVLSLPPMLVAGISPERFFIYGVAVTLFTRSGRLASACAFLAVFFAYGYFDGLFVLSAPYLVSSILSAVLPALLFILLPTPFIREMENKLVFYKEKHLSRIAINRNRAAIGKQLYEISSVFREIECTFSSLGETGAQQGAKEYIRSCAVEETCKQCEKVSLCRRKNVWAEVDKLVEVGSLKGRVSLIDLPGKLSENCINQSGILYSVNRLLGDYRKYMTETENAASGRLLLAGQAQGISEILKNLALEQSEPLRIYTDKERALSVALLTAGIVCSEVLIYGEENDFTLSLITFGKADVKKIAAVATHLLETPMMISERLTLSRDKFCCILRKKPFFDAAFGVSSIKKSGEIASGDTHSVIKIDERKFMVALSDGMGSGEYARRVSESTIALLESFYRAKMPSDSVLSTINKLLTFNREETFACVDIAVVDLDDGRTDIVKIGSPVSFILSGNTVKVLDGGSLPLGILDCMHPDAASYTLVENDVLLFLSDGITGAFPSTADLYDVLKGISIGNPQQLTDTLLQKALQLYGGAAKDDMTAVAVRLFRSVA